MRSCLFCGIFFHYLVMINLLVFMLLIDMGLLRFEIGLEVIFCMYYFC